MEFNIKLSYFGLKFINPEVDGYKLLPIDMGSGKLKNNIRVMHFPLFYFTDIMRKKDYDYKKNDDKIWMNLYALSRLLNDLNKSFVSLIYSDLDIYGYLHFAYLKEDHEKIIKAMSNYSFKYCPENFKKFKMEAFRMIYSKKTDSTRLHTEGVIELHNKHIEFDRDGREYTYSGGSIIVEEYDGDLSNCKFGSPIGKDKKYFRIIFYHNVFDKCKDLFAEYFIIIKNTENMLKYKFNLGREKKNHTAMRIVEVNSRKELFEALDSLYSSFNKGIELKYYPNAIETIE